MRQQAGVSIALSAGADEDCDAGLVRAVWRRLVDDNDVDDNDDNDVDDNDVDAVSGTGFRGVSPRALALLRREAARALAFVDGLDDDDAPWRSLFDPSG